MQGKIKSFKTDSQNSKILAYLQTGASLTCLEAMQMGLTHNLRSRISNLREAGHAIKSVKVPTNSSYIAEYSLEV
ncbi:MAG: helix-turn-helix domain-containing protein [Gammaproteobacteria bacterium]|nr:helix-turn-helix domain-containing protein [Gammaproteobacteria bacterium]